MDAVEEVTPSAPVSVIEKTEVEFESSGCGEIDSNTNGSASQASGMEWRNSSSSDAPAVAQKKTSYQPKSYADTAASSTWRSQPNHDRNFATESSAFPTLAESQSINANKPAPMASKRQTGAQSSFSYASATRK